MATFSAKAPVTDIVLQVAVPKSQKLALQPLLKSNLSTGERVDQHIQVSGPAGAAVRLRLRISYNVDGQKVQEQVDYSGLSKGLL